MNEKRYVSVICEYNPFHHGHLFQLNTLKEHFDGIVCIMSGNIVQRGSVAIADKYVRAEAALRNGANLVLELPVPWCCSSARDFAGAGVHIAHAVGIKNLAFGAEDDLEVLSEINSVVSKGDFSEKLYGKIQNNKNLSYPLAFKSVIRDMFGEEYAKIVEKPNNILALEYLRALQGKGILPFAVKRNMDHLSSSSIRKEALGEKMISMLPEKSAEVFEKMLDKDFPRDIKKLDSFFIGILRRMRYEHIPENIYSAPVDLVKKLVDVSLRVDSVEKLISLCTDKTYTSARVRRGLNSAVFGITHDRVHKMPSYTSVLAADNVGREILKNAKKTSNIRIITKPAHALDKDDEAQKDFLFAKGIEDIISLSSPIPEYTDTGKTPKII